SRPASGAVGAGRQRPRIRHETGGEGATARGRESAPSLRGAGTKVTRNPTQSPFYITIWGSNFGPLCRASCSIPGGASRHLEFCETRVRVMHRDPILSDRQPVDGPLLALLKSRIESRACCVWFAVAKLRIRPNPSCEYVK